VLLIPMTLATPHRWLRLAVVCTVASVLGALLGYAIGMFLYDSVGLWVLETYGAAEKFETLRQSYNDYGGWAVLFAAITPFPYKVLTIFSGVTGLNLITFIVVSIIGRAFRFFLVTWLLSRYGVPIKLFIEKYLGLLFTLFMILLIGGFYAIKFVI